jgi:preprotein translocase subunit SecG
MDLSAIIVVVVMTLLFFGFIVWMAIYSRKTKPTSETRDDPEIRMEGE